MERVVGWLRARDPGWASSRRAVRSAVVVPSAFAIAKTIASQPQVATFAAFGSFALLLFVDFAGDRRTRASAFAVLVVSGAVLIVLGTLVSRPPWLAVVAMAVVGFAILFAGVVSSTIAAAGRGALLAFILPVMFPRDLSDVPARLEGWAIAAVLAVPVALFVFPPNAENRLRAAAADVVSALRAVLAVEQPTAGPDSLARLSASLTKLRTVYRASVSRPAALSTGNRLLVQLVEQLDWLATTSVNACADSGFDWPAQALRLREAAADALDACTTALTSPASAAVQRDLARAVDTLQARRVGVADETLEILQERADGRRVAHPPGEFSRPLYAAHELGYTVSRCVATVESMVAADARPWRQRLVGRAPEPLHPDLVDLPPDPGALAAAEATAAGQFGRRSVWFQNSVRGAVGLAAAVLLARVTGQQDGFWIVLGAMSVIRSNALSTGATALRAVAGTVVGFGIGAVLVLLIGTDPTVLWILLPVAVLLAGAATDMISFAAGQAAFTVTVIILFNIIAPYGWRIGVLRIENVALGCAASAVAGLLFWPRGAGPALGAALGQAYATASAALLSAVDRLTGVPAAPDLTARAQGAAAAGARLDNAFRQYLAERGGKRVPLEDVTALVNGADRLRLASQAIVSLTASDVSSGQADDRLARPVGVLVDRTTDVGEWYRTAGEVAAGFAPDLPTTTGLTPREASFLDVVLPAVAGCRDTADVRFAERLLWAGQYVGDVDRLRDELRPSVHLLATVLQMPSWRR